MKTFVFLLTVWGGEAPDVHVKSDTITGAKCIALIIEYDAKNPEWSNGVPSCELDVGVTK